MRADLSCYKRVTFTECRRRVKTSRFFKQKNRLASGLLYVAIRLCCNLEAIVLFVTLYIEIFLDILDRLE